MDFLTANDQTGQHPASYYAAVTPHLPPYPRACGTSNYDVCIVGGGYTGLSAALHLAQRGYKVCLLEAHRVGFGASGRNGGQIGQGQRLAQDELEAMVGTSHARALWNIARQSVELVRTLAATPQINTPIRDGILHACHRARHVAHTHAYVQKMRHTYDYEHLQAIDRETMHHLVASKAYYGGLLDTGSGHLNPLAFALGLARLACDSGAEIFELSRVQRLIEGSPARLFTDHAEIKAEHVILAGNGYLGTLSTTVARHVMPINNFIVATEPFTAHDQNTLIRNNYAVADSKFVVNYFRFSEDRRLLFGGSESYGATFPEDIRRTVRKPLGKIFPQLKDIRLDYAWGGTLGITMTRMPYFSRLAPNIISCGGYSGHGVGMATLAGQIAADYCAGQAERFDIMASVPAQRFPGGPKFRHPLLILGMLWYSLRDRL